MAITALIGTKMGVDVHKEGCRDLDKANNKFVAGIETYENVAKMFEELLDTGDETNPGWIEEEFKFFPCVHKQIQEHNCKHGVDVFNCYDGCYYEMKNGTVS